VTGEMQLKPVTSDPARAGEINQMCPSYGVATLRWSAAGFTLLELMIVISIIIILAAITLPQYQRTIMHTRETVLRDDLYKMRSLIDQFAADKGRLPQSVDELQSAGYIRDVPVDPFTGEKDWAITTGEDPNSTEGEQGMTDIHSSSSEISTEGTPYSEW
jgi:general secretion pathway protein G